jgi:hypothetical protein
MSSICSVLRVHTLKDKYRRVLGASTVSLAARDFAVAFPSLQRARHSADYDPKMQFLQTNVASLIDAADTALSAFDKIDPAEQADILALMMVATRG